MITQLREYQVLEKIGEGGMGAVFKAMDSNLGRMVAIKALHPTLTSNTELIERFKQEARVQATLIHPNIVALYNFFEEQGLYYIVMEYIEGETLSSRIKRTGLIPPQFALPIFKQMLAGVGFAHTKGIVHRDLKPSNVLIDSQNNVKIMDFGIAKMIGDRSLTKTGTKMGTMYYMSPEQVLGEKDIDNRADIYSLGITFFEMLTAKLPFNTDVSDFLLMQQIVQNQMPSVKQHYPYVPDNIDSAIFRATRKIREERFNHCEEFTQYIETDSIFKQEQQNGLAYTSSAANVNSNMNSSPNFAGAPIAGYPGSVYQPVNNVQVQQNSVYNVPSQFTPPPGDLQNPNPAFVIDNLGRMIPRGIGGWLLVYVILFGFLVPAYTALSFTSNLRWVRSVEGSSQSSSSRSYSKSKDWTEKLTASIWSEIEEPKALPYIFGAVFFSPELFVHDFKYGFLSISFYVSSILTLLLLVGAIMLMGRVGSAYEFNTILWKIVLAFFIICLLANIVIAVSYSTRLSLSTYLEYVFPLQTIIILAKILISYFYLTYSKRVKATYLYHQAT